MTIESYKVRTEVKCCDNCEYVYHDYDSDECHNPDTTNLNGGIREFVNPLGYCNRFKRSNDLLPIGEKNEV